MQHHAINRSGNSDDVEHPPPHGYSASAKNIVMEKRRKGYMPATSERCRTLRQARIVEVPQILESQHLSQADGLIGVAGEVKIDLEREGKESRSCAYGTDIGPTG